VDERGASLLVGWLDSSLGAILERDSNALARFAFAYVTCIDSNTDLRKVGSVQAIVVEHEAARYLGDGFVVPGSLVSHVARRFNLFVGFDEVWCFNTTPRYEKPASMSIVGPARLSKETEPHGLREWMLTSRCELGVGDGVGMNYAAAHASTARWLQELSASS